MTPDTLLEHFVLYDGEYRVARYTGSNEFDYGRHYHDFYELQFYPHPVGTLSVGDQTFQVKTGDVALINIFEPHLFQRRKGCPDPRYCISLTPVFLLNLCTEDTSLLSIFDKHSPNYPLMPFDEKVFRLCIAKQQEFQSIGLRYGGDIMERALIYEILAHVYDQFYSGTHMTKAVHNAVTLIIQTVQYIDEHLYEDITLERLAVETNFNKYYISRTFKRVTGYSVNRYIMAKRIEKIAPLLPNARHINHLCKRYGFKNYSNFYKTFKRFYGVSPSDYKLESQRLSNKEDCNVYTEI